jgi:hypothetical protein
VNNSDLFATAPADFSESLDDLAALGDALPRDAAIAVDATISPDLEPPPPYVDLAVTLVRLAEGDGGVTSQPLGIDCGTQCTASVAYGSVILLTAQAGPGSVFDGWSGACQGMQGTCALSMTTALTTTATFRRATNYMFVTSTVQDGNLGGLVGADALCQYRAAVAGLPGQYRALLSTQAVSAMSRLSGYRGWMRVDRKPFTDTPTGLFVNRQVFYSPSLDEFGQSVTIDPLRTSAFTGTGRSGDAYMTYTCADWTSTAGVGAGGDPTAGSITWHFDAAYGCQYELRLYCFETDFSAPLVFSHETGPLAFQTAGYYSPVGGLAAADAQCAMEAMDAGYPAANYRAVLMGSAASAASRFDVTKPGGWVRPDGVVVVATRADLFGSYAFAQAATNVTATGLYLDDRALWIGGNGNLSAIGGAKTTCNDWADDTIVFGAGVVESNRTAFSTGFAGTSYCSDSGMRLLCLED